MYEQKQTVTSKDYLREAASDYKSEYIDGEIVAMSGGSKGHSLIAVNLTTILNVALENKPCRVFNSDMRLQVEEQQMYVYPDVMVVCGGIELVPGRNNMLTNPVVIVEVLSPAPRGYDRVKKFKRYRRIPSLQAYILVDSEQVHVTCLIRENDMERWTIEMYESLNDVLQIAALNVDIPVRRIYQKTVFEKQK